MITSSQRRRRWTRAKKDLTGVLKPETVTSEMTRAKSGYAQASYSAGNNRFASKRQHLPHTPLQRDVVLDLRSCILAYQGRPPALPGWQ